MKRYRGNKNTIPYGKYIPEYDEQEAYRWCINNNIIIFPEMKLEGPWSIEIKINGNVHKSPEQYYSVEVWKKMYEFYKYYYKKYANKF